MTETKEYTDFSWVYEMEDPEEAAVAANDAGLNFYKWWGGPPEKDGMRRMMQQDFTRGYKRMAALIDLAFHGWQVEKDKGKEQRFTQAEVLRWTALFNAKQAELAREHNEKILEDERNESV